MLYSTAPSHLPASQLSPLSLEREFELHRLQAFKWRVLGTGWQGSVSVTRQLQDGLG